MKRKRLAWFTVGCCALIIAAAVSSVCWMRYQAYRYSLDRALIAALAAHDTREARRLVLLGADPNTPATPLPAPTLKALWNRLLHRTPPPINTSPTAMLIACGAPLDDPGYAYKPPFDADLRLVEAMVQHGGSVNKTPGLRCSPLQLACLYGDPNTMRVLLEHGADANARDEYGTPLWFAVTRSPYSGVVRCLLEHGADPNFSSDDGDRLLSLARRKRMPEIAALLARYGAKPKPPDPPTRVPKIATILGVKVGYNGQNALIRRFGKGKRTTGGHSGGFVHWQTRNPTGHIDTDGFNYNKQGLVLEELEWSLQNPPTGRAPFVRSLPPHPGWLGLITPGMTTAQVSQLTAGRLPSPTIRGNTWTWKATGFVRPNPSDFDVYANWTAELSFQNGHLKTIHLSCEGGQRAP